MRKYHILPFFVIFLLVIVLPLLSNVRRSRQATSKLSSTITCRIRGYCFLGGFSKVAVIECNLSASDVCKP